MTDLSPHGSRTGHSILSLQHHLEAVSGQYLISSTLLVFSLLLKSAVILRPSVLLISIALAVIRRCFFTMLDKVNHYRGN
jgi:hypothetical protein